MLKIFEKLKTPIETQTWQHRETGEPITVQVKGNVVVGIITSRRDQPYSPKVLRDLSSGNVGTGELAEELVQFAKETLQTLNDFEQHKHMYQIIEET